MESRRFRRQHLTGAVGVVCLVAIVWLCLALYAQAFRSFEPVTVLSDRSGLLMDPGADVKLNGVVVGRVGQVKPAGDGARLTLELSPDHLDDIPSDVSVAIVPPTVFGAKYVAFEGGDRTGPPIASGAVIDGARVNVEVNQTFDAARQALARLDPARLNAALSGIAEALDGNGARIGQLVRTSDQLTGRLVDDVPRLNDDLAGVDRVARAYEPAVGDFVDTVNAAAAVVVNLARHEADLQAALTTAVSVSDHLGTLLRTNEPALADLSRVLLPTTRLLSEYSPEYQCLLRGIAENDRLLSAIMGGPEFGGTHRNSHTTFMLQRGLPAYKYPENLPKVAAASGPNCAGLPYVNGRPPYYNYDTGANPYVDDHDGIDIGDVPLGLVLFGQQYPATGGAR